jgi:hypothetical protein
MIKKKKKVIVKKRKKNNSKKIGSAFERDSARMISEWLTGSKDELVVWRASHSGSVATIAKKKGISAKKLDGDFQVLDEKYRKLLDTFFIDSKSLTKCNFFFPNPKNIRSNNLFKEWRDVSESAGDKKPLMIVKVRDDKKVPIFVMLKFGTCHEAINGMGYRIFFEDKKYEFCILTWEEFVSNNQWEEFVEKNTGGLAFGKSI